ncbi:MAG: methyltransferase regulatory domain-containing protein [Phenylobacterium sp.]
MPATPYDEVAYPSHPFRQTHPVRLALPAALFGLPYAAMATARVLEIGCGEGGNIIPMAVSYPGATIVGFDLAASAIAAGQSVIERLGLGNIRLETRDILDAGAELGQFDYIIAHGVYSWVPEAVRDGVLRVVQDCLAPEGLAFVSYNALPGCHLRMLIREMVMHHLQGVEGFEARVAGARAFLQLYIDNAPDDDATCLTIKAHCRSMLERDPHVVFHDELGPVFEPFYLHEFVAAAAGRGLKFLAEAEGLWWREELFPSSRGRAIAGLVGADPVKMQQYMDFVAARLFRQNILCRAERDVDRRVDYRRVRGLWASGPARTADPDPDLVSSAPVRFELAGGAAIAMDDPKLKQALHRIGQAWPSAVAVADLPDDPDVDEGLLQLFTAGYVDLTVSATPFAVTPGERPIASPLARLQLSQGQSTLCSLDHTLVAFEDEPSRRFLGLLDGARTRDELAQAMAEDAADGETAADLVERQLTGLARLGFLVA